MLDPDFAPRSPLFLLDKKRGIRGFSAILVPNGIFNRCTGFIFAPGKITTAITAKFLLPRFSSCDSAASLAFHGFKLGDHNSS
jgi:hypothetical protein